MKVISSALEMSMPLSIWITNTILQRGQEIHIE